MPRTIFVGKDVTFCETPTLRRLRCCARLLSSLPVEPSWRSFLRAATSQALEAAEFREFKAPFCLSPLPLIAVALSVTCPGKATENWELHLHFRWNCLEALCKGFCDQSCLTILWTQGLYLW